MKWHDVGGRRQRRRFWPLAEKRRIVAEKLVPGVSVNKPHKSVHHTLLGKHRMKDTQINSLTSIGRKISSKIKNIATPPPVYKLGHSHFDRIYHIHIRKCAGTSLNKSFIKFTGADDTFYNRLASAPDHYLKSNGFPIVGWEKLLLARGSYWYGFSHIPYHSLIIPPRTFTFTFLREPFSRLLSHYNMIHDLIKNHPEHPALREERFWISGGFLEFIKKMPRRHRENQLYMFNANFDVQKALENISNVNYIGSLETIETDFLPLMEAEFDIALPYEHIRRSDYKYIPTENEIYCAKDSLAAEYDFVRAAKKKSKLC